MGVRKQLEKASVAVASLAFSENFSAIVNNWLNEQKDLRRLRAADCVVLSPAKCGRTWLRVLLSHVFLEDCGISDFEVIRYDKLQRKNPSIPKIFFTHDRQISSEENRRGRRSEYYGKRVIFLIRDPRDIVVSHYFHDLHRQSGPKKIHADVSIYEYCQQRLPRIVNFLNSWNGSLGSFDRCLVVRYEDLRSNAEAELARALEFIKWPVNMDTVCKAVSLSSLDRMRDLERQLSVEGGKGMLKNEDLSNPNAFKARRGKVGGWKDYFSEREAEEIDRVVSKSLSASLGYS